MLDGRDLGRVFALAAPQRPRVELLGQQLPARREPARVRHPLLERRHHPPARRAALRLPRHLRATTRSPNRAALEVLGTPIDLSAVTCDAYVVAGSTDHIIPWTAAYRTTRDARRHERVRPRLERPRPGHRQSRPGTGRSSYWTSPSRRRAACPRRQRGAMSAVEHRGSWWDHWSAWLAERSGERGPAPAALGSAHHPPIEPAPGRYVHLT